MPSEHDDAQIRQLEALRRYVAELGTQRERPTELGMQRERLTVDGALLVGDAASPFDVTYGLVEESWELRTVDITGPFYPPATSTYSLTLDAYGAPVTVTVP